MLWMVQWFLQALGTLSFILLLGIVKKIAFPKKPPQVVNLKKPDWKQDVVYLCQFPLCPSVRSISPFAIKLETWLRVAGIKYECIYTKSFHPKTGQIPYIEINGEQYADSNLIIEMLTEKFNVTLDSSLTAEQKAVSHAVTSMVENFTAQTGFHYRYGYHMKEFLEELKLGEYYGSGRSINMWGFFQPYITRLRNFMSGLGRHENSVVWEMAGKDLMALSKLLGNKEYFYGDEPTSVDCMLFGHLAQFLFINIGFPQKTYLDDHCQNLVSLVERIKSKYWTDWDETIQHSKTQSEKLKDNQN